jgi:hypothetical protein
MKVYTMKVYPEGRGRQAYRTMAVSEDVSLDGFCRLIISSFEFDGAHMYAFCFGPDIYGPGVIRYEYMPEKGELSTKERISRLGLRKGMKFFLHYDFGDDWKFVISVQKIEDTDGKKIAKILSAKGRVEQYPDWDEDEDWDDEE